MQEYNTQVPHNQQKIFVSDWVRGEFKIPRHFTNELSPPTAHNMVVQYTLRMVQMAFCDLPHTFHKQVTNVSQHVFVIILWGIFTSPVS